MDRNVMSKVQNLFCNAFQESTSDVWEKGTGAIRWFKKIILVKTLLGLNNKNKMEL